jgi:predicted ArsR family transcriptional regulator
MAKIGALENQLSLSRKRIVVDLKEKGEMTADELASSLGISAVAIRRHLVSLEKDNLVVHRQVQRGVGRPNYTYFLGPAAESLFPSNYHQFAANLVQVVRELYGNKAVEQIFNERTEKLKQLYQAQIDSHELPGRIEQLVRLREVDGYMTTMQENQDGTFLLNEHNCPIFHVAEDCLQACQNDLKLFADILDADVKRVKHMAQGDTACGYLVRPKNEEK